MVAYYCKGSKLVQPFIELRSAPGGTRLEVINVSGKTEARKLATARNATPWNF